MAGVGASKRVYKENRASGRSKSSASTVAAQKRSSPGFDQHRLRLMAPHPTAVWVDHHHDICQPDSYLTRPNFRTDTRACASPTRLSPGPSLTRRPRRERSLRVVNSPGLLVQQLPQPLLYQRRSTMCDSSSLRTDGLHQASIGMSIQT